MLGDDGNQIGARSALRTRHSALERLFSGIQFGMDDLGFSLDSAAIQLLFLRTS
jgi:hypothetical protein